MENLKTIVATFILLACITLSLHAQNHKSKNTYTRVMTNENGTKIGEIDSNGTFKNAYGVVIGKYFKDDKDSTKYIYSNKTDKKAAIVYHAGTVKDLNDNILYIISVPDAKGYCKVYNTFGKECGELHKMRKRKDPSVTRSFRPRPTDEPYYPHPEKL